jgi:hypothetical protein
MVIHDDFSSGEIIGLLTVVGPAVSPPFQADMMAARTSLGLSKIPYVEHPSPDRRVSMTDLLPSAQPIVSSYFQRQTCRNVLSPSFQVWKYSPYSRSRCLMILSLMDTVVILGILSPPDMFGFSSFSTRRRSLDDASPKRPQNIPQTSGFVKSTHLPTGEYQKYEFFAT